MFEKLGGRKMVAATLTVGVGIGMAIYKGDVPDNLLYLLISVFGVFAGTNVINTVGGLSIQKKEASNVGVPVQDAVEAFNILNAKLEQKANEQTQLTSKVIESVQLTQNALSIIAEKVLSK